MSGGQRDRLSRSSSSSTSQRDLTETTNDCVRYFLLHAGSSIPIKRADLNKTVRLESAQHFEQIIDETSKILFNVYGYKLSIIDRVDNRSKSFSISNALPFREDLESDKKVLTDKETLERNELVLAMLILIHITLSGGSSKEKPLHAFLREVAIDPNGKHPLFGDVHDLIMKKFPKQSLLAVEKDELSNEINFKWGVKAEKEISKEMALQILSEIGINRIPPSWQKQSKLNTQD